MGHREAAASTPPGGLAQRIRHARQLAGYSQAKLARELGVSQLTVVNWERGIYQPQLAHRRALAALLGGHPADYIRE